jgi:Na+/serine symporter
VSTQRLVIIGCLLLTLLIDIAIVYIYMASTKAYGSKEATALTGHLLQVNLAPLGSFGLGAAAAAQSGDAQRSVFFVALALMVTWCLLMLFPAVVLVLYHTTKEAFDLSLDAVGKYGVVLATGALAIYFAKSQP